MSCAEPLDPPLTDREVMLCTDTVLKYCVQNFANVTKGLALSTRIIMHNCKYRRNKQW